MRVGADVRSDSVNVTPVLLQSSRFAPVVEGPPAALYVMVAAHGRLAKVGALESAANVEARRQSIERHQRTRDDDASAYPLSVVAVGEVKGLVVGRYRWVDGHWDYHGGQQGFDQRWADVEHLESAVRLCLARRLGRLSRWPDWIELDKPIGSDEAWLESFEAAWAEVDRLGSST